MISAWNRSCQSPSDLVAYSFQDTINFSQISMAYHYSCCEDNQSGQSWDCTTESSQYEFGLDEWWIL